MLAALTLSTVIIWKVLNNIIDNDNANDDEQVEAGMSDAADVMRDLLRKGLQVDFAIRIMLDKKSPGLFSLSSKTDSSRNPTFEEIDFALSSLP